MPTQVARRDMQDLALDIAHPAPAVRELELKFPTAALATLVAHPASLPWPGQPPLKGAHTP